MSSASAAAKVVIVGPLKVGKSTIANFLAEPTSTLGAPDKYKPTVGLRIREFERDVAGGSGSGVLNVNLWDVSGDQKYEGCWPAIIKDAVGVIIVYNPDSKAHEKEAELWYEWFVSNAGLSDRQCLVFAHRPGNGPRVRPPRALSSCHAQVTSFESPGLIRMEFDKFLSTIANLMEG